jgi:hypothetical protein
VYLLAADGSSAVAVDNSAEMLPTAGSALDWEVVAEPGNTVARRRWKRRFGVALNHPALV